MRKIFILIEVFNKFKKILSYSSDRIVIMRDVKIISDD